MGPTEADKERAFRLVADRRCPHCDQSISLRDAISMVQGGGYVSWVQVELEDGRVVPLEIADVNPQTMNVMNE